MPWVELAAEQLAPSVARITDWLSVGPLQHADETGMRIAGQRRWLVVNSTRFLTHLAWHAKRGRQAFEAIGIWPHFRGRAIAIAGPAMITIRARRASALGC
jgi:transposase